MTLSAGKLLGPYEILSLVGSGGMGEVYRARDTRLSRTVAVKTLTTQVAHRPDLKAAPSPITVVVNWRPAPGK